MQTKTKIITFTALFLALAVVLSFVEIVLFPAAPYLKYDPALVPTALSALWLGPVPGLAIAVLYPLLHAFSNGNFAGALMNIIISLAYVLPIVLASRFWFKNRSLKSAILGVVLGSLLAVAMALVVNLTLHPLIMGTSVEQALAILVPVLLPFNIVKVVLNSVIVILLFSQIRYNFK